MISIKIFHTFGAFCRLRVTVLNGPIVSKTLDIRKEAQSAKSPVHCIVGKSSQRVSVIEFGVFRKYEPPLSVVNGSGWYT